MIKQQINPSFTLTFNDINVTAPQRPHLQKPHFPDTIPIAELHWRCSRLSRHWWSDVICSPLPVLKQWLNSCWVWLLVFKLFLAEKDHVTNVRILFRSVGNSMSIRDTHCYCLMSVPWLITQTSIPSLQKRQYFLIFQKKKENGIVPLISSLFHYTVQSMVNNFQKQKITTR